MISALPYPLPLRFLCPEFLILSGIQWAKWLASWPSLLPLMHLSFFPLFLLNSLPFFFSVLSAFIYYGSNYRILNAVSSKMEYDSSGFCSPCYLGIWSFLERRRLKCLYLLSSSGSALFCLNVFSKLCLQTTYFLKFLFF